MKTLTTLMLAALLAGCGWDMDSWSWDAAEKMCQPFGGARAADMTTYDRGKARQIKALCMNGHRVEKYFTSNEVQGDTR